MMVEIFWYVIQNKAMYSCYSHSVDGFSPGIFLFFIDFSTPFACWSRSWLVLIIVFVLLVWCFCLGWKSCGLEHISMIFCIFGGKLLYERLRARSTFFVTIQISRDFFPCDGAAVKSAENSYCWKNRASPNLFGPGKSLAWLVVFVIILVFSMTNLEETCTGIFQVFDKFWEVFDLNRVNWLSCFFLNLAAYIDFAFPTN